MTQIMLGLQAAKAKLFTKSADPVAPVVAPISEAQKAIQTLATQLKGVEGKYGFFSIALVRLKNFFGRNLTANEKVQLEFFGLCSKVNNIAAQHLQTISKFDPSNADSVRQHDEAVVNQKKELAPLFKQAVELAVTAGNDRMTSIQAVKLIFAQETSPEIGTLLNESLTTEAAVGSEKAATVQSTVALLSDVAAHTETLADLNPGTGLEDIHATIIGNAAKTPGMAQSILGAVQGMYAKFDAACVREATPQEVAEMEGHFMTELNKLLNGDQKITEDSLKQIQYKGIRYDDLWETPAEVAADLEQIRGERAAFADLKRQEADLAQVLSATQAELQAVRADLANPVEFTLEDFSKVGPADVQAAITALVPATGGKTIADALVEMTTLAADIRRKSDAKNADIAAAVQGQKQAADNAKGALDALPTPADINKEIEDTAAHLKTVEKAIADGNKDAAEFSKSAPGLRKAGKVEELKAGYAKFGQDLAIYETQLSDQTATQSKLARLKAEKDGKIEAYNAAKALAETTALAYTAAVSAKDTELSSAISDDVARLQNMQAQKYSLTGNQLVQLAQDVPAVLAQTDTISVAVKAADAKAKQVVVLADTVRKHQETKDDLAERFQQAFDVSSLKHDATLSDANVATLNATHFDAELKELFKTRLTKVLRTQDKEMAIQGIAMGKSILAEVAALSVERYSTTARKDVRNTTGTPEDAIIVTSPLPGSLSAFETGRIRGNLSVFDTEGEEVDVEELEEDAPVLTSNGSTDEVEEDPDLTTVDKKDADEDETVTVIDATQTSFVRNHPIVTGTAVMAPVVGGVAYYTGVAAQVVAVATPFFATYVIPYLPAALGL